MVCHPHGGHGPGAKGCPGVRPGVGVEGQRSRDAEMRRDSRQSPGALSAGSRGAPLPRAAASRPQASVVPTINKNKNQFPTNQGPDRKGEKSEAWTARRHQPACAPPCAQSLRRSHPPPHPRAAQLETPHDTDHPLHPGGRL